MLPMTLHWFYNLLKGRDWKTPTQCLTIKSEWLMQGERQKSLKMRRSRIWETRVMEIHSVEAYWNHQEFGRINVNKGEGMSQVLNLEELRWCSPNVSGWLPQRGRLGGRTYLCQLPWNWVFSLCLPHLGDHIAPTTLIINFILMAQNTHLQCCSVLWTPDSEPST